MPRQAATTDLRRAWQRVRLGGGAGESGGWSIECRPLSRPDAVGDEEGGDEVMLCVPRARACAPKEEG